MTTFREAISIYESTALDLSERTRKKLKYLASSWERRTTNRSLGTIGPVDFAEYRRNCLRDGLSPHSIESNVTDVCTVLKASGTHLNPGRRLKRSDPDPQSPSLTDLGKWYAACEQATSPHLHYCSARNYMRAFFSVSLWTGFRLADLFALTAEDFTPDGIRRKAHKTGKVHLIPPSSVVARHVALLGRASGRLFPAGEGCSTRLRGWMHSISDAAGVPHFGPQNLRIAAVNSWRDAGGAEAAGIIHGESLGGRSAIRWYLKRSTPMKVLTLAAPRFVWPSEMLLPAEQDRRETELDSIVQLAKRLRPEQLENLRRCALAFAE